MTSVDDLMQPITVVHAKASIYQVLEQLGVPTTSWKPGAVVRAVVILGALLYQGVNLLTDLCYAWLDPRVRLH